MKNFVVKLFRTVAITVSGVSAESGHDAVLKAQTSINYSDVLDNHIRLPVADVEPMTIETVISVEGNAERAQVSEVEVGVNEAATYEWIPQDGSILQLVAVDTFNKSYGHDRANLFVTELMDSFDSLTELADIHGARTLADLLYLQAAIMKGSFVDAYPKESRLLDILAELPSVATWMTYVKVEYLAPGN